MVQRSFHTYVHIDSCNYKITIGVENLMLEINLFEFEFGKRQRYYGLEFQIKEVENAYSMNLSLKVCLNEVDPCLIDVQLMRETLLPKLFCEEGTNWPVSDFSSEQWLIQRGQKVGQILESEPADLLLGELGIQNYLLVRSCDLDNVLPSSMHPIYWSLNSSRLFFECCLSVDILQKFFRFSLELDACNYKLLMEIENLKTEILLFDFEWGTHRVFRLQGALQIQQEYVLVERGNKCLFDTSGSCMLEFDILNNYKLPKPLCNWSLGFKKQDFSLDTWNGGTGNDILTNELAEQLMKELGIKDYMYLEHDRCRRDAFPYFGSKDGWNNECSEISGLQPLNEPVVCHISGTCTNIQCCLDAGRIPLHFHAYMDLDACNYKLTVGIEKLHFDIMLLDYEWGVLEQFWLSGLIRIQYSLEDLKGQRAFVVNLELSVCYSHDDCPHNFTVFMNMLLPKPVCNLTGSIPDFSLTEWVEERGQTMESGLANYLVDLLMEKLGIASYLSDPSCDLNKNPYALAERNGWANDCPELNLPDLADAVVCHMMDTCVGVECCLNVGLIDHSLNAFIILDSCNSKLEIGIEQFKFELDFDSYILETKETFSLENIVFIDYSIFNLELFFLVNATVRVCLEVDSCVINEKILENTRLPKPQCDWSRGFISANFSLSYWMETQGLVNGEMMSSYLTAKLMEELDIGHYLVNPPCDRSLAPYNSSTHGCVELPTSASNVACHLQKSCTAVDCCVEPSLIGQSFQAELSLDACDFELVVRIENRKIQIPLFEYPWREEKSFELNGFLVLNYTIDNLQGENVFLVTAKLFMCQSGNSCDPILTLLENTKLPKPACSYMSTDFQIPNFSLATWRGEQGLKSSGQLTGHHLSRLLEELGLARYLKQDECNRHRHPYVPQNRGWNKECTKSVELPTLEGAYGCTISDSCTSVDCCLEVETIDRSFNVFVSIDGCNNKLSVGIEKLTFEKMLFDYQFGTHERVFLKNVVRLDFSILNLESEKKYLVDMNLQICFEEGDCILTFPVLNATQLPKPTCDSSPGFIDPVFNLENWVGLRGVANWTWTDGPPLSTTLVSQLLNVLGVAQYTLEEECVHEAGAGWNNECNGTVDHLPTPLPSDISCNLQESCNSFNCCMSIGQLGSKFFVSADIDPCNYKMVINIEKLKFEVMLFDFDWGQVKHYWMYGFIRVDFKIVDLAGKDQFMLDLDLRVCMNGGDVDCEVNFKIFNNTRVPKRKCDWSTGFVDRDFSFSSWIQNEGVVLEEGEALDTVTVTQLLTVLGIGNFMSETPCRRNMAPYGLATDGWTNDCLQEVVVSPLHDPITCVLPTTCTGVDCCVDIDVLGKAVNTFVNLDSCTHTLDIGIERLKFRTSLLGYKWGDVKQLDLFGVFRINFTIEDLAHERKYLMNMGMSECLKNFPHCVELEVMDNVLLPKPICDWKKDFLIPGFSLSPWLTMHGYEQRDQLDDYVTAHLLEVLGVAEYLLDTPCSIGQGHYTFLGWTDECHKTTDVPALPHPDTVSCHIGDSCSAVDCCVYIEKIDRSMNVVLNMDSCNYRLEIGIEKFKFNVSLLDFGFGENTQFWLNGVLRLDFTIEDLSDDGEFLVSLTIAVCFGGKNSDCVINEPILTNIKLLKLVCNWNTTFLDPGFSLKDWQENKDFEQDYVISQVMDRLGISEFMEDSPCDRQTDMYYKSSLEGWTSDCPTNLTPHLPAINGTPVTCYLSATCTGVRCCVDASDIGQSFTAFMEIDACQSVLRVGIERLQFTRTLFNYTWGQEEQFYLFGVLRIDYSIEDMRADNEYLGNLRLRLCYEASGNCSVDLMVLDNTRLLKLPCTWDRQFLTEDFSFLSWLRDEGVDVPHGEKLDSHLVWQLMDDLGIAAYLEDKQCNRSSGIYESAGGDGWRTINCLEFGNRTDLGRSSLTCVLGSDCTHVDCCVDVDRIRSSFHTVIAIDSCSLILTVGIEKLVVNIPLLDYQWGKSYHLKLLQVSLIFVAIQYTIVDLYAEKKYLVSVDLRVCLESGGNCLINQSVFENTKIPKLPKHRCDWGDPQFAVANFNLTQWLQENELDVEAPLDDYYSSKLLGQLGLGDYLLDTSCQRAAPPFSTAVDNWSNSCPLEDLSLSLDGPLTCHLQKTCTAVECCVDVTRIGRSFHVFFSLDPCEARLRIGIEKMTYDLSLLDYEGGVEEHFYLQGVIRLDFSIVDLSAEEEFLLNMELRVCYDNFTDCQLNVTVFENTRLPKPTCNRTMDFLVPEFSLQEWRLNNSYPSTGKLSKLSKHHLLEYLGIAGYLSDSPCELQNKDWTSDCDKAVDTVPLPSSTTCSISSSCTAVDCCTNIDEFTGGMAVRTYVDLDPCAFTLTVGIEEINFTKSLIDYNWDTTENFSLGGLVRLRMSVEDFPSIKEYALYLHVEVCFESSEDCNITVNVFNGRLPKRECDFNTSFALPDFRFDDWLKKAHYTTPLPDHAVSHLLHDLGVAKFVGNTSCNHNHYSLSEFGWNKGECLNSSDIVTPELPDFIACYIPTTCMEIDCCLSVDLIGRSFRTVMRLDPCNFVLHLEIEKFVWDYSLQGYDWGTDKFFYLKNVIRMDYNIRDLNGERKFLVNLNLSVCFEEEKCIHTTTVVGRAYNTELPKASCDWKSDFDTPGFNLTKWKMDQMSDDLLPDHLVSRLLENLGVAAHLDFPSCNSSDKPYISAPGDNDSESSCADVIMPNLDGVSCYIPNSCSSVQCCMEVDVIKRPISALLSVDTCNFVLTVGFDKFVYTKHLFGSNWDVSEVFQVKGVFKMQFSLKNLFWSRKILVNLSLGFCFESGAPACTDDFVILTNVILPQEECEGNRGFIDENSSLNAWMGAQGFPPDQPLQDHMSSIWLEKLGVAQYLGTDRCQIGVEPFEKLEYWTKSCRKDVSLATLDGAVSCHLGESCTDLTCCVVMERLRQTAQIKLILDPCDEKLTVGIENFVHKFDLIGYVWGRYKIDDYPYEGVYVVSLSVSVCYESGEDDCLLTFEIMKNLKLWKDRCFWNSTFRNPNFELEKWGNESSIDISEPMDDYAITLLEETLGLSKYFQASQCSAYPAAGDDGWDISGCENVSGLGNLFDSTSCKLFESCSGVECCLNISRLRRNIHVKVILDPCQYTLTLTIEKLEVVQTLFDYDWGRYKKLYFFNLVFFFSSYTITDITVEGYFLISMVFKVCFDNKTCPVDESIFENILLPKEPCTWDNGFIDTDFSLSSLIEANQISPTDPIPGYVFSQMAKQLDISRYLETPGCILGTDPFNRFDGNWNKECASVSLPQLTVQTDLHVACHIDDQCGRIQCCLDVVQLARTFLVYIQLDTCQNQLEVGIEKFYHRTLLTDYNYGQSALLLMRSGYSVVDLYASEYYLTDLTVSVCFETSTDCNDTVTVLNNTLLPKSTCQWDTGYEKGNFSLSEWISANGVSGSVSGYLTPLLLMDLGIGDYLLEKSCVMNSKPYASSGKNWTSDCDKEILNLPTEMDSANCHFSKNCDCIDCCVESETIGQTFTVAMEINPCSQRLSLAIEKFFYSVSLIDYNWGKEEHIYLKGLVKLILMVDRLLSQDVYVVDMKVGLCYEYSTDCDTVLILHKSKIPILSCDLTLDFIDRDFSLSTWVADNGTTDAVLPLATALHLQHVLGIDNFMTEEKEICTFESPGSSDACGHNLTYSNVSDTLSCHITSQCTEVDCCMMHELMNRTFHIYFYLDPCDFKLTVKIEKLVVEKTLLDFEFGEYTYSRFVTKSCYNVMDLKGEEKFLVNLKLFVCWEDENCDNIPVIANQELSKPNCDWDRDFEISGFNLTEWQTDQTSDDQLPDDLLISFLLEDLGIAGYLDTPPCNSSDTPYISDPGDNGTCATIPMPNQIDGISCYILDSCSELQCCMEVDVIKRPISALLSVDTCNFVLTVGFDKFVYTKFLSAYDWVVSEKFQLKGVFQMELNVRDLFWSKKILVNLRLGVCFQSGEDQCNGNFKDVLTNVILPKEECDWNKGWNRDLGNFSLDTWTTAQGLSSNESLHDHLSSILLETLGVARYFDTDQCVIGKGPFVTSGNWSSCSKNVNSTTLDGPVSCHLGESCTDIKCCVGMKRLSRQTARIKLSLDPCNKELTVGIENFVHKFDFIVFDWATSSKNSPSLLFFYRYKIDDYPYEGVYVVSLSVSVCYESGDDDCPLAFEIMKNLKLWKETCFWNLGFQDPDFELEKWGNKSSVDISEPMDDYAITLLEETLGLSKYFQASQCSAYPAASDDGWDISECGNVSTLGILSDSISCKLDESCTGVECCLNVSRLRRNIHVKVALDPCQYTLNLAIEKLEVVQTLFDHDWGRYKSVLCLTINVVHYTITDITVEGYFLISMVVKVCFDNKTCPVDESIFENILLPKMPCTWDNGFMDTDFSLGNLTKANGISSTEPIPGYVFSQMAKQLEISRYLETPGCKHGTDPFIRLDGNWNNECASVSLPQLTDQTDLHVACHIDDQCGRIQCCLDVVQLARTFLVYIHLDTCQNQLEVGIEKFYHRTLLTDYNYGTSNTFSLGGLVRMIYRLDDLSLKESLLFAEVEICLDADTDCELNTILVDNVILPKQAKQDCGVSHSGFALNAWRTDNKITEDTLPPFALAKLLENRGISQFMKDEQCAKDRPGDSGCSETISRPVVTGPVSCHMSTCTAIDCCMDFLDRTLNFHLSIDPCLSKLSVGIENLQQQFILKDFGFGNIKKFFLPYSYSVVDLYASEYYLTDLTVSVCLETSTDCNDTVTVLNNTLLPKSTCQWDTGYEKGNFSLSEWMAANGVSGSVSGYLTPLLLMDLGIGDHLLEKSCERNSTPYAPSGKNWTSDCDKEILNLPTDMDSANCYFSKNCDSIDCCVESETIGQTFTVAMEINPCSQRLSLAIEKFSYSVSLIDYNWGKEEQIYLRGLVKLSFMVERLLSKDVYVVDMRVSLCYENSESCDPELTILDKSKIPILSCDLTLGFIDRNFSVSNWVADRGKTDDILPLATALHLQHVLGIDNFMTEGDEVCTFEESQWSDACGHNLTYSNLSDTLSCHITSECTEVDCCMMHELMNRTFHIYFYLDPCDFKLTVKIEKLVVEKTLLNFEFGEEQEMSLKGLVTLFYNVTDLKGEEKFLVNLKLFVCWEDENCDNITVIANQELSKPTCDWEARGFDISGFNLTEWQIDQTSDDQLPDDLLISFLLEDLGIAGHLDTPPCNSSDTPYISDPGDNGSEFS
ncbi:hypothetical protein ScPMuIL_008238, partial [Solemya velum]